MKDIYELIVKKSKDGIWVTDKNDVIIFTNKRMVKIAGILGSEILNKNVLKDFPNEITENFIRFYIKAKTTLKSVSYEAKVVTPSGRETWQIGQLTPKVTKKIFDGIICTVKDITESKESEEILREKTEIVNTIVESSPMGIHMYSLKSNGKLIFIGANPAADILLNVDNKQFIGKTIEQAFPPLAKTEIPEKYSIAASKGISWQTEQINYEDNKICGAFEVHAFQISQGKMVALFMDITERKQIEEALKSSEERLNIIFESAPDAIFLVDNKGTFIDGNKTAEELMGYKKEELIGKSFLKIKLLSAKDLIKATKSLMKSVQRKSTGPEEYNLIRKDDSQIPVEIITHPIIINNKKIILGIARNIIERKQAEDKLKSRNSELEVFYEATVNRELKLIDLKKEINELLENSGKKQKYKIPI